MTPTKEEIAEAREWADNARVVYPEGAALVAALDEALDVTQQMLDLFEGKPGAQGAAPSLGIRTRARGVLHRNGRL